MATVVEEFPVMLSADELRAQFESLAHEWRQKAKFLSNLRQSVMLEPYQRIIGLGRPVVKLLLEDLQREPDWWFWALEAITGEDPIPKEAQRDLDAMAAAWVAWGRKKRLL